MKNNQVKEQSGMFNFLTLLGLLSGVFLIIFLKHRGGKKTEQGEIGLPSRVKNPNIPSEQAIEPPIDLNQRQEKILASMEEKGRMRPNDIYSLIPGVSTRTVRRDMDVLVEAGLVKQEGSTKATTYIFVQK